MPPSRIRPALLTPAQRLQFTAFPDLTEHLIARYYTLTDEELTWVLDRRRDANRLGFAVQLTVLKHLGRGLDVGEIPPEAVLVCLGEQLDIDPAKFDVYARRDATRREHFGELCDQLGYRTLSVDLNRALRAWLIPMAVATPQPFALMSALLDELRRRKILVPRISVLERIVTQARTQAEQAVHHLLGEIIAGHEDALDALLQVPQDHAMAPYTRLKQWPSQAKPSNILKLIERLHFVRQFPVNDGRLAALPESRLSGLAAEGKRLSAASLAEYAPAKRRAVIFARLVDVAQTLTDDLLDMHDRLMLTYLRESERASVQEYQASGQALVERLQTFEQVCAALVHARTEHLDPYQAVERVLPWGQLVASVNDHDAAQHLRQLDPLQHLARSFQRVRTYAGRLLEALEFRATPSATPLLRAIDALKTMYRDGKRTLPDAVPLRFVRPRWAAFVMDDRKINRPYYELCVLDELRLALRAGDIWVDGSRKYRDLEEYLLPQDVWQDKLAELSLGLPETFDAYWQERGARLRETLEDVSTGLSRKELVDVSATRGRIKVTPQKKLVPPQVEPLARQLAARIPRVKITDLVQQVAAWTGCADCFTDLRSGSTVEKRHHLLTALLAEGLNLGMTKMAEAVTDPDITARRLMYLGDWYLRDETYKAALAEVVNFQNTQPLAAYWGDGTTSSSDGQRFPVGGHGRKFGHLNAKYGREPGILFYTHVSDQYAPFHTKAITANVRDALHVLDGLLYHQSRLEIQEHYTDTAGFTDQVFGMCQLLGFRFAPRIRDLTETRLYTPEPPSSYPVLGAMVNRKLNLDLIRENWDELRRLTVSVRQGTVTASLLMSKLAAYPRQNSLAQALGELGRIERTLFTLEWLSSPALRHRVHQGLNKGEALHALTRAVVLHRGGEIRDRSREAQDLRANGVGLLVAMISAWNTVALQRAIKDMRRDGQDVPEELLTYLSPLGWEHIGLTGDYSWRAAVESNPENAFPEG
ncbi:Tn3 family transposase [Deinococcus daejeonensis]|uniref:DDE transposase n=1 Tax=Deinococcus daejeonensis TaxID=1007098 RepID=A0ABQ2JHI6_9DEIO|nr:Tn3 family transposase [Deinococcus daejeonensis]GGN45378.1 DDE transposase [Deinococcus daejeonensis]